MKDRLQSAETIMQKDRLMRHDRRHFEALLYQLLEEGRVEEAKKYLKERLSMEPKGMHNYCENTTVNVKWQLIYSAGCLLNETPSFFTKNTWMIMMKETNS